MMVLLLPLSSSEGSMSWSEVRVVVEGKLALTGWKLRDMSECHSCVCGYADTELDD